MESVMCPPATAGCRQMHALRCPTVATQVGENPGDSVCVRVCAVDCIRALRRLCVALLIVPARRGEGCALESTACVHVCCRLPVVAGECGVARDVL